jgi:Protochlamydia outer membrane protein
MKSVMRVFSALAFTTAIAFSSNAEADTSVQFGIGYRSDDVKHDIKIPHDIAPETHSHLNMRDLEIVALQGKLKGICGECLYYRADAQYGWILDGSARESDQFAIGIPSDHSTTIVSTRVHNDITRDYVADFNFAIGYPLQQCWCPNLQVVPTLGFSYDTQRVGFRHHHGPGDGMDGFEIDHVIPDGLDLAYALSGRNNFRATWWGPWVGLDLAMCHEDCWNLYGEFEYHFGTRARRDRATHGGYYHMDHYARTKSAFGYSLKVGSSYSFYCNWYADAYVTYKRFTSDEHHDELTWRTVGISLDLGYVF